MLLLLITTVFAAPVRVKVVDSNTGKAIKNASLHCDDSLTTKKITDDKGDGLLECNTGTNTIQVFHEEYGKKSIPLTISNSEGTTVRIRLESPYFLVVEDEQQTAAITRHVVTSEELKRVPGTFGDPVRALQSLPGVARPNIAEGAIVVRGAEGINTGFYVDGMPVPYMFHTMVGRSVIIPSFIDDIEFFPGGMPSNYGEVTQAVVNVRTNTTPTEGTKVNMRVDFLDGGIALEQKINDQLIVRTAGRYSWVGGLISSASKLAVRRAGGQGYEAAYLAPQYWDQFADVRYQISKNDELSVLYLASRDTLYFSEGRYDFDGDGEPDPLEWEDADLSYNPEHWIDNRFWRTRLLWRHNDGRHSHQTWIAGGTEAQQNLLGAWWLSRQGPYRGRVGGPSVVARRADKWLMPEWGVGSAIVAGGQLTYRWFVAEDFQETFNVQDYDDVVEIRTEDEQMVGSMWVEPQWQSELWYVGLGLRGAAYSWDDQTTFQPEPRLSVRRQMPQNILLKGAVGRYTQLPPLERYAQGIGNPDLNIMTAWQASMGLETNLTGGLHIDSSLFGGWMQDLVVRDLEVDTYNDGDTVTTELQPYYLGVQGLAYGWEGLFRYRPSDLPWWGWISVTLSKAMRLDENGRLFPSDYDMPIAFTAVGAYDLGKDWEVSARVQTTSGQPYTPFYGVYVPRQQYFTATRGDLNSERYPAFFRLDVRAQKVWSRKWVDWMLYVDVYNATSRANPFIATYNYDYSELVEIASLPIIPTLGLEATY